MGENGVTPPLLTLEASGWGEAIDPGRHRLRMDVKAVTLHGFNVQSTTDGWEAWVILDM